MALSRMGALVESLRELKMEGREVMLVSSGAVGLGRVQLGLTKEQVSNPENFIDKQHGLAVRNESLDLGSGHRGHKGSWYDGF